MQTLAGLTFFFALICLVVQILLYVFRLLIWGFTRDESQERSFRFSRIKAGLWIFLMVVSMLMHKSMLGGLIQ